MRRTSRPPCCSTCSLSAQFALHALRAAALIVAEQASDSAAAAQFPRTMPSDETKWIELAGGGAARRGANNLRQRRVTTRTVVSPDASFALACWLARRAVDRVRRALAYSQVVPLPLCVRHTWSRRRSTASIWAKYHQDTHIGLVPFQTARSNC